MTMNSTTIIVQVTSRNVLRLLFCDKGQYYLLKAWYLHVMVVINGAIKH